MKTYTVIETPTMKTTSDQQWMEQHGLLSGYPELQGDYRIAMAIAQNAIEEKWDILSRHPAPVVRAARERFIEERDAPFKDTPTFK